MSPTVGAYFFAEDYVKFCSKLKYYLSLDLEFISLENSRHYSSIISKNGRKAIVGMLDDVVIIFLHYANENIVLEKWNRRIRRVNWDRLILKFSYQNDCTDELVREFLKIENYPKFVFVGETITNHKDEIVFKRSNGKETIDETVNFDRFINPVKIINERL